MANLDDVYMGTALLHAKKSKALRAQVGAVIVTKTGVIIPGYNGQPAGCSNECEDPATGLTKLSTIHAETNCVLKAAREGISINDSTVYVTLSPCLTCAAMLVQAGVKRVLYMDQYRDASGIQFLNNHGVECENFTIP
jgi:dCMP deaminase